MPNYYRPDKKMTIFGFGRIEGATENLRAAAQSFSIAFIVNTDKKAVAKEIKKIVTAE